MAVNRKTNVTLSSYQRNNAPVIDENLIGYLQDELQRIEQSLRTLVTAGIEVLDEPPLDPVKGMVKYNISPWDPLGDSSEGLVLYNGTAWVDV